MPNAALLGLLAAGMATASSSASKLQRRSSKVQIIVMTGAQLSPERKAICQEYDFPFWRKPFLANDILNLIRARLFRSFGGLC